VEFRPVRPDDADFCFRARSQAFNQIFHGELTTGQIAAGVNAYPRDEIILTAEKLPIFIIEKKSNLSAFSPYGLLRVYRTLW
jgi:hypothetical protein